MDNLVRLAKERLLRRPVEVDEIALEKARERGAEAQRLIEHPLVIEAFERVEAAYMRAWRTSAMEEVEKRERAHDAVLLLTDLKGFLHAVMRDGEGAAELLRKAAED
jgi:hypothetical protein